jgi:hypothetical protein
MTREEAETYDGLLALETRRMYDYVENAGLTVAEDVNINEYYRVHAEREVFSGDANECAAFAAGWQARQTGLPVYA